MRKNKVDFGGRRQEKMEEKIKFISVRVEKEVKRRRRYIWNNFFDSTTFSWRNCKSI